MIPMLVLAAPAVLGCEPSTTNVVSMPLWPDRGDALEVPAEVVLWAREGEPVVTLTPADGGDPLPVQVVGHANALWAVIPEAPLTEGATYVVADEAGIWATLTVAGPADPAALPAPIRRTVQTEVFVEGGSTCGYTTPDVVSSSVSYTVCGVDTVLVWAVGDEEPAVPAVDDLGPATPSPWPDYASVQLGEGYADLGAGDASTVWLGTFGRDGSFSGWLADDLPLDDAPESRREDLKPGVSDGSTPPTWWECPSGDWILGEPESLAPAEEPGQDTDEAEAGTGCATPGGRPGCGWAAVGVLALLGRRRRG